MKYQRPILTINYYLLLLLLLLPLATQAAITAAPSRIREAKRTIAIADSMDAEHQLYSDTAALHAAIRTLNKPITRHLHRNTLAAAYYYMGRNLSADNAILDAAECYIACDRLHPDDPIRRGRVNACMAYICSQQCEDTLALVFNKRAIKAFPKGGSEWHYAYSLLSLCENYSKIGKFHIADSLWQEARLFRLDSMYEAYLLEKRGFYFYEQQQYDSALTYYLQVADFPIDNEYRCYNYLKVAQIYESIGKVVLAYPYAEYIVSHSQTPNFCKNAYYTLINKAKHANNAELTAVYSYRRQDYSNMLTTQCEGYAQAVVKLQAYIATPNPFRPWKIWLAIALTCCIILSGIVYLSHWYRKQGLKQKDIQLQEKDTLLQQQAQSLQHCHNTIQEMSEIISIDRSAEVKEHIAYLQSLYPQPERSWLDYEILRNAVSPALLCFCNRLQQMQLSEKEITLCVYTLLYDKATLKQLADYLCYSSGSIRTAKRRVAKKLGLDNAYALYPFLLKLAIIGIPIWHLK